MSNISLEGNASGTGTFTIAAPNTSSNFTLTLPQASGTIALGTGLTGVTDSASPFETALGEGAGGSSTGVNNTFIGFEAGNDNTTGANNTAVGYQALDANTTGQKNTAVGTTALGANTTGTDNVAVGWESLRLATTAQYNVGVGPQTLYSNTTGSRNTAVGSQALLSNTTGTDNIAIGSLNGGNYGPLWSNTTGQFNVGIGGGALGLNTTASNNTAIGYNALQANTTGASNTAVGYIAGSAVTTGTSNTLLGEQVGNYVTSITTGANNVWVGSKLTGSAGGVTQTILIGWSGLTDKGNNTGYLGATSGVYQGNNSSSWSTTSDQRLKKNIVDNTEGLDIIGQLRVRNFEYRTEEEVTDLPTHAVIKKTGVQLGVIAQELQQVCPDCVTEQSTGVLSVDTDEIFWHMVNAIKELSAKVTALEAQLATPPATPPAEPNA